MAAPVSAANIRLGADISGLLSGLRTASQAINQHTAGVNMGLTRAYREADAAARTLRTGIGRLGNELQTMGQKMALIGTLPTILAAGAAFKQYADLQKLTIGLKQYGESIQTVKELAKLPNVSIEGAAQSLIQLRAVGVESGLAQRGIKAFANALTAAGKSSTDLNPALTNVVQMLSTGVVSSADVKELANRIPQVRKALMDAFGTASGEALTKIGPEKVVMGLIAELEKIPNVAGGAGMALEKFGDSAQFAAATMGESIDKAFGLTKIISDLADTLGNATDYFADLSPDTQKFSLSLVALAAAVPLVVTAIGAVISAGSALAVGLGVAGATVGIVATAVVAGGALIITYWDDIKKALTNTGVWSTVVGLAQSSFDILSGIFNTVANALEGDWADAWVGIKNTTKGFINSIITMVAGLAKAMNGIFSGIGAGIQGILGVESNDGQYRKRNQSIDEIVKKLKLSETISPDEALDARRERRRFSESIPGRRAARREAELAAGGGKNNPPVPGGVAKKEKEIDFMKKYNDILKEQKRELQEIKDITKGINLLSPTGSTIGKSLQTSIDRSKDLLAGSTNKIDGMVEAKNNKVSAQDIRRLATYDLKGVVGDATSTGEIRRFFDEMPMIAGESEAAYGERLKKFVDATDEMNANLSASLKEAAASAAFGFGEMLGDLVSGVGGVESFAKNVMSRIGELLKNLGKSLIGFGTAGIALKVFANKPALALAAGVALTALGQVAMNSVKSKSEGITKTRFAKGGFAYGEMNAIVGDNPNAKFDPEMIAPYSKVHNSIVKTIKESGRGGTPGEIVVIGEISGSTIKLAYDREATISRNLGRG